MPPSGTVLVVDDEPEVRKLIRTLLEAAGMKIHEAENGEAALQAIIENDFDVIVTDNDMPKMTGEELYRAVCNLRPELRRRIILVTGGIGSSSFAMNCTVILKPFDHDVLIAAVRRTLTGEF